MNPNPKNNMINETIKSTESKNEVSTPKNKDSKLFSFLPKEVLEEIEVPETKANSNSTKICGNYSDIPELPKINQKSEMSHQSPDPKMKYRRFAEQKQVKKPAIFGIYSNSDNTASNSNVIHNSQMYFRQNEGNNNLGQLSYQNSLFHRKYSGSNPNTNSTNSTNVMQNINNNMNYNNMNSINNNINNNIIESNKNNSTNMSEALNQRKAVLLKSIENINEDSIDKYSKLIIKDFLVFIKKICENKNEDLSCHIELIFQIYEKILNRINTLMSENNSKEKNMKWRKLIDELMSYITKVLILTPCIQQVEGSKKFNVLALEKYLSIFKNFCSNNIFFI